MKKTLMLAALPVLVLGLAACDKKEETETTATETAPVVAPIETPTSNVDATVTPETAPAPAVEAPAAPEGVLTDVDAQAPVVPAVEAPAAETPAVEAPTVDATVPTDSGAPQSPANPNPETESKAEQQD